MHRVAIHRMYLSSVDFQLLEYWIQNHPTLHAPLLSQEHFPLSRLDERNPDCAVQDGWKKTLSNDDSEKEMPHHMLNSEWQLSENFHRFALRVDAILNNFIIKFTALNELSHKMNST